MTSLVLKTAQHHLSKILFKMLKAREQRKLPTMIGSQYSPDEWVQLMTGKRNKQGEADSIRRRLIDNGYVINIQKE